MVNMSDMATKIARQAAEATEQSILLQLNDFVSRGLIELRLGQQIITQDMYASKLQISQSVELVLKDKEYIEELEKENTELKELINKMKAVVL